MRSISATLIALVAVAVLSTSALAWHVIPEPGSAEPKVTHIDPRGDPVGRLVINNQRPAFGKVCVPDERWSQGTIFSVGSKTAGPGECIKLRTGSYSGTWSNSSEVERFTIKDTTPTAITLWSHRHKNGGRVAHVYQTPRGCKTMTGWHRIEGGSIMWATNKLTGKQYFSARMAKDGWYQKPWRGYTVGTSC